jgi:hypothetical protein
MSGEYRWRKSWVPEDGHAIGLAAVHLGWWTNVDFPLVFQLDNLMDRHLQDRAISRTQNGFEVVFLFHR